ncbi:MAG: pyridoxamine 5'-phosphate oxidase family protein [Actinomycetota bacterium]|nr:pyridoxamine 5'-phosphate oxidase family protein [Actinomycetota bacterium]
MGFVADGHPVVLPTVHARVGSTLYLPRGGGQLLDDQNRPICAANSGRKPGRARPSLKSA